MIKAIIFDFDGVLVDSEPIHYETEKALVEKYNKEFSPEAFSKTLGKSIHDALMLYKSIFQINIPIERFLQEHDAMFLEEVDKKLTLMDGASELIEMVKKNHYKYAIASSGSILYIERALRKFGLYEMFQGKVSTIDMVTKGKPAPDLFLHAAKTIEVEPVYCLIIEDSKSGIAAGKSAGMQSIWLSNQYVEGQESDAKRVRSLRDITYELVRSM